MAESSDSDDPRERGGRASIVPSILRYLWWKLNVDLHVEKTRSRNEMRMHELGFLVISFCIEEGLETV